MAKKHQRQMSKLTSRKLASDSLSTDRKNGRKRPGSMNPKKQS